ncbi:MAG TPA: hypothetical protein VFA82_06710 [Gaiellaceae bacterium]|nr:hypothetical protein [Gaiellaceae bacterium]
MTGYRRAVAVLATVMIALGFALVVVTLIHGVGIGLLIGALFIAAGAGRLTLLRRRSR